jgi:hypothetical protein
VDVPSEEVGSGRTIELTAEDELEVEETGAEEPDAPGSVPIAWEVTVGGAV